MNILTNSWDIGYRYVCGRPIYHQLLLKVDYAKTSNVKWTFFQDRKLSFSCFCSKKRSNIFVFETKFRIKTKRFLSVLENLGSNAFVLVRFQIFFQTIKNFVLSLKNPGATWNVLVSFCYHFLKIQTFCFDSWPLTKGSGSGSCYFRKWPSRWQRNSPYFFLMLHLRHFSKIKSQ